MLINQNDPHRIETRAEVAKRKQFLNGFRKIPGVKWWQINVNPHDPAFAMIEEVTFDQVNAGYKAGVQNRIDMKQNVLYVPAINKRNAEKKFRPMIEEIIKDGNILKYITK